MSRINTNVPALVARHKLSGSNADLAVRLQRLSTGLRINRGADDPAGLIISERLRSEISSIDQSIGNAERASNVISTAEAALSEVSALLTDIKGLIIEAANTGGFSKEEIDANQLQIDSAIESITRIANTTEFAGLKLINGAQDYILSGVDPTQLQDIQVFGTNFGTASSIPVNVEVINSAEPAQLFISGNTAGAPGAFLSSVSFEIQGPQGAEVLTFASGAAFSAVIFAVNQVSDVTGVSAALASAADPTSGLLLTSQEFGSDEFVSVRKITGGDFLQTYDVQSGRAIARDTGEDVLALVNGNLALGTGAKVSLRATNLAMELQLTRTAAQTLGTYEFDITGGGTSFQIGTRVDAQQHVGFGIPSVTASHLGNESVGFLNTIQRGGDNSIVNEGFRQGSEIVDVAIQQVASLRGRLGAFERNVLQTTIRSQQIALENITASESQIRDADFAAETSALTRAQILVNAGTSTLALANSTAQQVLSLLGG